MEILPNVHWIEGQRSNIYLQIDDEGPVLVDTGMPGDLDRILTYLEGLGLGPADLRAILVTHADTDHAGSAAALQARSGAPVYAGAETTRLLKAGKSPKHMPWIVQFLIDRFARYRQVSANSLSIISDGDTIPESEDLFALSTPGHTLDHYSFFNPVKGILFAGDALHTRGGRLQNSMNRVTADKKAARRSAFRLLQKCPAVIACGHGRPMQGHDAGVIMDLIQELQSQADGRHDLDPVTH